MSFFDKVINNLPVEIHLPSYPAKGEHVPDGSFNGTNKYSFAGPGTNFIKRLQEGYQGINDLDKAAKVHDYFYWKFKDREKRTAADRILATEAQKIAHDPSKSGYERAMAAFVYKTFMEGGIAERLQGGKGMTLRERKPVDYIATKYSGEKTLPKAKKRPQKSFVKLKPVETVAQPDELSKMKFAVLADELHRPVRKNFQRRRVYVHDIDDTWGMDIVFMTDLTKDNDQYKYILTIIDCFSKYAWAVPLKTKDAKVVYDAFISVINRSKRKPKHIWVDKGSEFYNSVFTKWLNDNHVTRYSTYENFHNPIIERFNRTLKTNMWRRFTFENSRRWVDLLDGLLDEYNKKNHRSIGMTPTEASDTLNRDKVDEALNPLAEPKLTTPRISIGDIVRISRMKEQFEKGFHPNWSEELFKVVKVNETFPRTYKIEALDGEPVTGSFYEHELLKSTQKNENLYRVDKVITTKKVKGKEMALVKWAGYDKPSWEKVENILD